MAQGVQHIVQQLLIAGNANNKDANGIKYTTNGTINLNGGTEDGWTCLHWAAAGGHSEIVSLLTEASADNDATSIRRRVASGYFGAGDLGGRVGCMKQGVWARDILSVVIETVGVGVTVKCQ